MALGVSEKALGYLARHSKDRLCSPDTAEACIERLTELKFRDPLRLLNRQPTLLGVGPESIEDHVDTLEALGIEKPVALAERDPVLLALEPQTIYERINHLESIGVEDPVHLMEIYPSIVHLPPEELDDRLKKLRALGVSNPARLLKMFPAAPLYDPETLVDKIDHLRSEGFDDPLGLVERYPSILGFAPETVTRKLRFLGGLIAVLGVEYDTVSLVEKSPNIMSSKRDKTVVLARIAGNSTDGPESFKPERITSLFITNLECILIALHRIGVARGKSPAYSMQELRKIARGVREEKLSREAMRDTIRDSEYIDSKVKRRYFRGYPDK